MFLPRIRCIDCPGKVYTTLPLSMVEDFEKHLKNRHHRERVQERKKGAGR
jgi:SWI/SNF-related matrix-associated actin-dependent regulator of chromatin subfamily B protein 1